MKKTDQTDPPTRSRASAWLGRHGRIAKEDTTAAGLPDPLRLAVFVSLLTGAVLYLALRMVGMDVQVSLGAAVVLFVVFVPALEAHYRGR